MSNHTKKIKRKVVRARAQKHNKFINRTFGKKDVKADFQM